MKLSHLVPTSMLSELPEQQTTHLALANLITDDEEYRDFYCRLVTSGHTVILDYPAHERLDIDLEQWLGAVEILRPSAVVLPDSIDSADETLLQAGIAIRMLLRKTLNQTPEYIGVPHGKTQKEYLACAEKLWRYGCRWFGISLERQLSDADALNLRQQRLEGLLTNTYTKTSKYHLLGISETASELIDPFFQEHCGTADASKFAVWWLTSWDSAVPYPKDVPINRPYPGRKALGGSVDYFNYCGVSTGLQWYLERWSVFAEKGEPE